MPNEDASGWPEWGKYVIERLDVATSEINAATAELKEEVHTLRVEVTEQNAQLQIGIAKQVAELTHGLALTQDDVVDVSQDLKAHKDLHTTSVGDIVKRKMKLAELHWGVLAALSAGFFGFLTAVVNFIFNAKPGP